MGTERQVSVSRHIAAPADQVWAMVSDITRMGEWSPEATAGAWRKGATGPAVGATFTGQNRNESKKWSTVCTVNTCESGRAFGFLVDAGPFKIAEWRYDLVADADGTGCTVTETWTDRRGSLITKLGKPLSGVSDRASHNRAGMEQTLERLAAAATGAST
jgi:ligand-binding SRPBCC domain-containing protein